MSDHNLKKESESPATGTVETCALEVTDCCSGPETIKLVTAPDPGLASSAQPQCRDSETDSNFCSGKDSIRLANFELDYKLGAGALGQVFHASNLPAGKEFAIKLISPDYCRADTESRRLLSALKKAAGTVSPHLAAYYDCGLRQDGSVYLVTDCLPGKTLKDLIDCSETFRPERFIDIFRQVCQALNSLHEQNILHGNLKPTNVFLLKSGLLSEFVKLVDFGIVADFARDQKDEFLRKSGSGINYMSPEQCLGYALDARSDIYSLGLIMYEILTGKPLVSGHSQMHTVVKQLNIKPGSIREIRKDIPESLDRIIMKCLEKNRDCRYSSITDLELDLDLACAEVINLAGLEEVTSSRAPAKDKTQDKDRAAGEKGVKKVLAAVICAGVLACIVVAIANVIPPFFYHPGGPGPHRFRTRLPQSSEGLQRLAEQNINYAISQPGSPIRRNITIYDWRADARAGARPGNRSLNAAAYFYGLAIDAHQREHPAAYDREYKERQSGLQTSLGELLTRATFADQGGRLDRKTYYTAYKAGPNPPKLHPRFPGLKPPRTMISDYVSAKVSFDQAKKTLENNFGINNADLLWDSCFTEFNLGNYEEAINMQAKLIDIYKKQAVQDREALIMSYDNLGRLYLWTGNSEKAAQQFKNAQKLDNDTYKLANGIHTEQVNADLAFALLMEGKYDLAASQARKNIKRIAEQSAPDGSMTVFNTGVLSQALTKMGKKDEADKLELQLYRSGQFLQPMP